MCLIGSTNLSSSEVIFYGALHAFDYPLMWCDYLTFILVGLIMILGSALNSFIIWVKKNSEPSSFDLVQMNLAISDAVGTAIQ